MSMSTRGQVFLFCALLLVGFLVDLYQGGGADFLGCGSRRNVQTEVYPGLVEVVERGFVCTWSLR